MIEFIFISIGAFALYWVSAGAFGVCKNIWQARSLPRQLKNEYYDYCIAYNESVTEQDHHLALIFEVKKRVMRAFHCSLMSPNPFKDPLLAQIGHIESMSDKDLLDWIELSRSIPEGRGSEYFTELAGQSRKPIARNSPNQDEIFLDEEDSELADTLPEERLRDMLQDKNSRHVVLRMARNKLRKVSLDCRLEYEKSPEMRNSKVLLDSIANLDAAKVVFRSAGFRIIENKSSFENPFRRIVDKCERLLEQTKSDVRTTRIQIDDTGYSVQLPID